MSSVSPTSPINNLPSNGRGAGQQARLAAADGGGSFSQLLSGYGKAAQPPAASNRLLAAQPMPQPPQSLDSAPSEALTPAATPSSAATATPYPRELAPKSGSHHGSSQNRSNGKTEAQWQESKLHNKPAGQNSPAGRSTAAAETQLDTASLATQSSSSQLEQDDATTESAAQGDVPATTSTTAKTDSAPPSSLPMPVTVDAAAQAAAVAVAVAATAATKLPAASKDPQAALASAAPAMEGTEKAAAGAAQQAGAALADASDAGRPGRSAGHSLGHTEQAVWLERAQVKAQAQTGPPPPAQSAAEPSAQAISVSVAVAGGQQAAPALADASNADRPSLQAGRGPGRTEQAVWLDRAQVTTQAIPQSSFQSTVEPGTQAVAVAASVAVAGDQQAAPALADASNADRPSLPAGRGPGRTEQAVWLDRAQVITQATPQSPSQSTAEPGAQAVAASVAMAGDQQVALVLADVSNAGRSNIPTERGRGRTEQAVWLDRAQAKAQTSVQANLPSAAELGARAAATVFSTELQSALPAQSSANGKTPAAAAESLAVAMGLSAPGEFKTAAAAAPPTVVSLAQPLFESSFAPAMATRVSLLAADGVQTAQLHLNPAEMGPVAVQIVVEGQQAQVSFHAEQADTCAVLERSLPDLAAALRDAGLTLSGGGVFQQPPGQSRNPDSRPSNNNSSNTAASRARPTSQDLPLTALGNAPRPAPTARGVLDLYA